MHFQGGDKDIQHFEDYRRGWRAALAQKVPLVCYREGSDDIVGLNFNLVTRKEDEFFEKLYENVNYFIIFYDLKRN